jgi:hypothetical protein
MVSQSCLAFRYTIVTQSYQKKWFTCAGRENNTEKKIGGEKKGKKNTTRVHGLKR